MLILNVWVNIYICVCVYHLTGNNNLFSFISFVYDMNKHMHFLFLFFCCFLLIEDSNRELDNETQAFVFFFLVLVEV